jgi:4-carboxymuconolactone decarboxylase
MAVLPYPVDYTSERTREFMARIPPLNLLRMESHAEGLVEAIARLSDGVLNRSAAPENLRLCAFLRLCEVVDSPYELAQLAKVARAFGLTEEKIEAARSCAPELSREEAVAARLAEELAVGPKASRETLDALRSFLGPREVCELIIGIGFYLMQSRVIETLEIELEEPPVLLSRVPDNAAVESWRNGGLPPVR